MPAKTGTYTLISSTTLTTTTATVTFSSIPATYTDLFLVVNPLSTNNRDVILRFNSDTGTNYSITFVSGYGGGTPAYSSGRTTNQGFMYADYYGPSNTSQSVRQINIMDYSNTTTYKTAIIRSSNATAYPGGGVDAIAGLWRSTSAISTIAVSLSADSFLSGSVFKLYGIEAGNP